MWKLALETYNHRRSEVVRTGVDCRSRYPWAVTSQEPTDRSEDFWREYLTVGSPSERSKRRLYMRIPNGPRCRICAAPFGGVGAQLMRVVGKRQSEQNPNICNTCFTFLTHNHGGAEIEMTLLFADIRGSTSLAEGMSASEFHALLDRFYQAVARVIFDHDGMVDKYVGDEVVAQFYPLLAGEQHAQRAIEAARGVLQATGHADASGPWVPVGVGVHTGRAWMGAVGDGSHTELTAVGDAVNTHPGWPRSRQRGRSW
jgi:adenylate cyclase